MSGFFISSVGFISEHKQSLCYTNNMQRIGVLRGGVSSEYRYSLETGAEVARAIQEAGLEAIDMFLDRDGVLHIKGIPASLDQVPAHVDYVWNALHGKGAEDGQIAELLDSIGVPFSGSGATGARIASHKAHAKEIARKEGVRVPESLLIIPEGNESVAEITRRVYTAIAPPWVVKPLSGSGGVHTFVAHTMLDLSQMVEESLSHEEPFLVEQYIFGKEAAVGVVDDFRGSDPYTLPLVELKRGSRGIFDPQKKEEGDTQTVLGGSFRSDERKEIEALAGKVHRALGATHYSESQFILDPYDRIWFIETDTHPHLAKGSSFFTALEGVGISLQEFVKHIIGR